jgi:hypothetical protein
MAPLIFISYRRDDGDIVRALELALRARLGRSSVLRDRTSITGGDDLRRVITDQVASADVIVAVIGSTWDAGDDPGERRLDRGDDWVRFELSLALGWQKLVVPVLLDGSVMPRGQELPTDIRSLADRAALPLRDSDWDHDVGNLVSLIAPGYAMSASGTPIVRDSGPVAGGDVVIRGDIVAGRDLHAGQPNETD